MNISSTLLTKTNLRILEAVQEPRGLREIAARLHCSPAKVHQAVALFRKHDLVTTRKDRNRLLVEANRASAFYQKIRALMNVEGILNSRAFPALKKVGALGLYGSVAQGTDDPRSDVDLLLITDAKALHVQPAIRALEEALQRKVNPLILTRQRLARLAQEDPAFHLRLKLTAVPLHGALFD